MVFKKGIPSAFKGKTYIEIYGSKKRADEEKQKRFHSNKGGYKLGPLSKEVIEKIRKANMGHIVTKETRKKISNAQLGHKATKKTKKKMSKTWTNKITNGYIPFNCANFKRGHYSSKNNGLVFYRSSWELACMKYFDKADIDWVYETKKNRFYLKSINKYYINDFYLPKENKYIQVKGYVGRDNKFNIFQNEYRNLNTELWNRKVLEDKGILGEI